MLDRTRMEEGDQTRFAGNGFPRFDAGPTRTVTAEMVGSADIRVIDMQLDPKDSPPARF